MRPELERLQRIEHQLLGQPAADWHVQELLDADLAADTNLQRQLYQVLYVAGQQQLRHELVTIHHRLYGKQRPGRVAQFEAFIFGISHQLRRFFNKR